MQTDLPNIHISIKIEIYQFIHNLLFKSISVMKTILVLHIYACLGSKTKYINLFVSGKYHREIYISQKMFIKFTTTLAQSPTQEKFYNMDP